MDFNRAFKKRVNMPDISQLSILPTFGESFLNHHAGKIITDPYYAIVELVANCWDAGANGSIIVSSRVHNTVLEQAHSRTFNLLEKIESLNKFETCDKDLEEIIYGGSQIPLF
jgi:hypothetical protein